MFKSAVKKCLKESVQDGSITVTRNTLAVLCGIANSLAEDAASTAALIAQKVNKKTIGGDEVIDAFNLILTGELKKLCVREIRNMMSKSNTQKPPK
ncbi:H2B [Enterospora canceri]|uniref:H2B n=1 Tax=Enterospora canceri TaxID=1081671 RepID=A0A1Y1S721_9MICR|nr:H2B [Enterospora canceri]